MTWVLDRILDRAYPELQTMTLQEYRRRGAGPAPIPARPAPVDTRPACATCGEPFTPGRRNQRFCSAPCRRWWHYGPGSRRRAHHLPTAWPSPGVRGSAPGPGQADMPGAS